MRSCEETQLCPAGHFCKISSNKYFSLYFNYDKLNSLETMEETSFGLYYDS